MMRAIAIAAALVGGCTFSAEYGPGLQCGEGGACPEGQRCFTATNKCVEGEVQACALRVAAGGGHTCMVRSDKTVWCWGRNEFAQLGNGMNVDSPVPVQVAGVVTATAVATGSGHSCALLEGGKVQCWGRGTDGQLGRDSDLNSAVPMEVESSVDFVEVVAGDRHTCGRDTQDLVWCWGGNGAGQIGNNTNAPALLPDSVVGITASRIAAGGASTCAIDASASRSLYCWGANGDGQLGVGNTDDQRTPALVPGISNVESVDIDGRHMCAIEAGHVRCAGLNNDRQLGVMTMNDDASPTLLSPVIDAVFDVVEVGDAHTCARATDNTVWCWGRNEFGERGIGTTGGEDPERSMFQNVAQISAAEQHTCVLTHDGVIACAGYNNRGQLGNGRRTTSPSPQQVPDLRGMISVAAGDLFSCSLGDGKVTCWGENDDGELADDSTTSRAEPRQSPFLKDVQQLVSGDNHACALVRPTGEMGSVWCWGANGDRQLGSDTNGDPRGRPVRVEGLVNPTEIAAGGRHNCAIDDEVAGPVVKCWGRNENLQLGNTDHTLRTLHTVMLDGPATGVAAGSAHSCAMTVAGGGTGVRCWGSDEQGQLGTGAALPMQDTAEPQPVASILDAKRIFARGKRSYAIVDADHRLRAWGHGCEGLLGNGNAVCNRNPSPIDIGLVDLETVAAGNFITCAVRRTDQKTLCWGSGEEGQLGNGRYDDEQLSPAVVSDVLPGARAIAAGDLHVCVVTTENTVWCWGHGASGELGYGKLHDPMPSAAELVCEKQ